LAQKGREGMQIEEMRSCARKSTCPKTGRLHDKKIVV